MVDIVLSGSSPPAREQHGFARTVCGCEFCRAPCRYMPGSLDVADLPRLVPPGHDVFVWAEEHLRALTDKPFPTLVPARQANGHCQWLVAGQCAVHANAPYSCAFFDSHQDQAEIERRSGATIAARRQDAAESGLYFRVWRHLCQKGLIGQPGDRVGLAAEVRRLRCQAQRQRRRLQAP